MKTNFFKILFFSLFLFTGTGAVYSAKAQEDITESIVLEHVKNKKFNTALQIAKNIKQRIQRDYALAYVAEYQAKAGSFKAAEDTALLIETLIPADIAYKSIIIAKANTKNIEIIKEAATSIGKKIKTTKYKDAAHKAVAEIFIQMRELERASSLAKNITESEESDKIIKKIADIYRTSRQYEKALSEAKKIERRELRQRTVHEINIHSFVITGQTKEAFDEALKIKSEKHRDKELLNIFRREIRKKQPKIIEEIANHIKEQRYREQCLLDIINNYTDKNKIKAAERISERLELPFYRGPALVEIASFYAKKEKLKKALKTVEAISKKKYKNEALRNIAIAELLNGNKESCLEIAEDIDRIDFRDNIFVELVSYYLRDENYPEAKETIDRIESINQIKKAKEIYNVAVEKRDMPKREKVVILTKKGDYKKAIATAQTIEAVDLKGWTLRIIAVEMARSGNIEDAEIQADRIKCEECKDVCLMDISVIKSSKEDYQGAFSTAKKIGVGKYSDKALAKLANKMISENMFIKAKEAILLIRDTETKNHFSIKRKIKNFIYEKKYDEALKQAESLKDIAQKESLLIDIAIAYVLENNFKKAIEIADRINGSKEKLYNFMSLFFAEQESSPKNLEIIQNIKNDIRHDRIIFYIAARTVLSDYKKALEIIKTIRIRSFKAPALFIIETMNQIDADSNEVVAVNIANSIGDDFLRSFLLDVIAKYFLYLDEFDKALFSVDAIVDEKEQQRVRNEIVAARKNRQDDFKEALAAAVKIEDTLLKNRTLANIASKQGEKGKFKEALKTVDKQKNEYYKSLALKNISSSMLLAGIIKDATQTAVKIKNINFQNLAFQEIITKHLKAGNFSGALKTVTKITSNSFKDDMYFEISAFETEKEHIKNAIRATEYITDEIKKDNSYKTVIKKLASLGQTEEADKYLDHIGNTEAHDDAAVYIAKYQTEKLLINEAFNTASMINLSKYRDIVFSDIVSSLIRIKEIPEALKTTKLIEDIKIKSSAIHRIVITQLKENRFKDAVKSVEEIEDSYYRNKAEQYVKIMKYALDYRFEKAIEETEKAKEQEHKDNLLKEILTLQAYYGSLNKAFKTANKISSQNIKNKIFWLISELYAQADDFKEAVDTAQYIDNADILDRALMNITVEGLLNDNKKALNVAKYIKEKIYTKQTAIAVKAINLLKTKKYDEAVKQLSYIKNSFFRDKLLRYFSMRIAYHDISYSALKASENIKNPGYRKTTHTAIKSLEALKNGGIKKAIEIADEIKSSKEKSGLLAFIGKMLVNRNLYSRVDIIIKRTDVEFYKYQVLRSVADFLMTKGTVIKAVRKLDGIKNQEQHDSALKNFVEKLLKYEIFNDAIRITQNIDNTVWRDKTLSLIADALLEKEDFSKAESVADKIYDTTIKSSVLAAVAKNHIKYTRLEEAIETVDKIENTKIHDETAKYLVNLHLKKHDITGAVKAASSVKTAYIRDDLYKKIVSAKIFNAKYEEAYEITRDIRDRLSFEETLLKILKARAKAGRLTEAIKNYNEITDFDYRNDALVTITETYVKKNKPDNAMRFAVHIKDMHQRDRMIAETSKAYAKAGLFDKAKETAHNIRDYLLHDRAFADIAQIKIDATNFTDALNLIKYINDDYIHDKYIKIIAGMQDKKTAQTTVKNFRFKKGKIPAEDNFVEKDEFHDCFECPRMTVVPAGQFFMGELYGIQYSGGYISFNPDEQPVRKVTIPYPFAVGMFEVTEREWKTCMDEGICKKSIEFKTTDKFWKLTTKKEEKKYGNTPVQIDNPEKIEQYLEWINKKTGKKYRLPTEAEWEYFARAGTDTHYWWGDDINRLYENIGSTKKNDEELKTGGYDRWEGVAPVGSFAPNPFKIFDVSGNVSEWIKDCHTESYKRSPLDNSANKDTCDSYMIRGGSFDTNPIETRIANRTFNKRNAQEGYFGFRVVRNISMQKGTKAVPVLKRKEAIIKSPVPGGSKGIKYLVDKNRMRPADDYDRTLWNTEKAGKSKDTSRLCNLYDYYTVNSQFHLPKGIEKYCFIIPSGMKSPTGEPDVFENNTFLIEDEHTFIGRKFIQ